MPDELQGLALARALELSTWLREVDCPHCTEQNVTSQHTDERLRCVACRVEFIVPPVAA